MNSLKHRWCSKTLYTRGQPHDEPILMIYAVLSRFLRMVMISMHFSKVVRHRKVRLLLETHTIMYILCSVPFYVCCQILWEYLLSILLEPLLYYIALQKKIIIWWTNWQVKSRKRIVELCSYFSIIRQFVNSFLKGGPKYGHQRYEFKIPLWCFQNVYTKSIVLPQM